jgi:uncharacterized membrane protein YcaP (DUF421 family)
MQIVVRTAALYVFVWMVLRAMGRKELAEMSSFDLILVIVMGDLIQQGVTGDDRSVVGAMIAVATMGLLTVFFSYVTFRFGRARDTLEGIPIVIVQEGKLLPEVLRIERLTEDEVIEAAREHGIADLAEVQVGIIEASGQFSFVRFDRNPDPPPPERHGT